MILLPGTKLASIHESKGRYQRESLTCQTYQEFSHLIH